MLIWCYVDMTPSPLHTNVMVSIPNTSEIWLFHMFWHPHGCKEQGNYTENSLYFPAVVTFFIKATSSTHRIFIFTNCFHFDRYHHINHNCKYHVFKLIYDHTVAHQLCSKWHVLFSNWTVPWFCQFHQMHNSQHFWLDSLSLQLLGCT